VRIFHDNVLLDLRGNSAICIRLNNCSLDLRSRLNRDLRGVSYTFANPSNAFGTIRKCKNDFVILIIPVLCQDRKVIPVKSISRTSAVIIRQFRGDCYLLSSTVC
jgi:hypothetical protein